LVEDFGQMDELLRESDQPPLHPLFGKTRRLLDDNKLQLTKSWLGRIISDINDLSTLESFPTQESISASVELVEGIARALEDEEAMQEFAPGGRYYDRAAILGASVGSGKEGMQALVRHTLALEESIWSPLAQALRREDHELLSLVLRLRTCLQGIAASATESYHERSITELDRLAHTDPLTGLFNRRYLVQQLERQVEMYKRYRHPFSLLMLDADNLKWINDTYGHAVGDAALSHVAAVIRSNVRDVDLSFRFGGDEFMILMPETEVDVVRLVGDRISVSLRKTKLKTDHTLIALQVSQGSASCPLDGLETEELLQQADASLYQMKQQKARQG